jgi:hypothetical protein
MHIKFPKLTFQKIRYYLLTRTVSAIFFLIGISFIPYLWCHREANRYFDDSYAHQLVLQRGVESWIKQDLNLDDYATGSNKFNGEWLFGTYLMSGLGFGQMAMIHPELKAHNLPLIEGCIEKILSAKVKAFDKLSWGNDPIDTLSVDTHDHAAFLGYFNLLLSMNRLLNPETRFARLNENVSRALVRRLEQNPILTLETYPNERYPVDNCAVIASIGLYDQATGANHSVLIKRWMENFKKNYIDPKTGLLFQSLNLNGKASDYPRGSGSALGLYFLSYANPAIARQMYHAVKKELASTCFGFGTVREYPRGIPHGRMDVDSGPIVWGYGFSSTGFTIAGSKIFRDRSYFKRLYAIAYFAGAPYDDEESRTFVSGGPLGTAILFAMLTAPSEGTL